jgi:sugar lactone lactonase YvrE
MPETVRLLDCGDVVGESAVWCGRTGRLFWVDIVGRRIHAFSPGRGRHQSWATPEMVTSIGLRRDGGAVVGLRRHLAYWDYGERFESLAIIEPGIPDNRLNEGKVGPDGAFWVGTMQNNIGAGGEPVAMERSSGAYYRVWPSGRVERLTRCEYGICNTMAWDEAGRFLCADTLTNSLYAFDFHDAGITSRRTFGSPFTRGLPDGSALDVEGYLWNCRVGGGCVVRFAPDGAVDRVVELPCAAPTSCAFGGEGLRTLYVTSARFGLPHERAGSLDEGALFTIATDVPGCPEYLFG